MREFARQIDLYMLHVVRFKGAVVRLMEMDQNRYVFTWTQLSSSQTVLPCGKLHGFPMGSKLQPKIIDSTKQFEETHW